MKPKTKLGKDYQFIVDKIEKEQEKFSFETTLNFPYCYHRASVSTQVYAKWKTALDQKIDALLRVYCCTCAACVYNYNFSIYDCHLFPEPNKKSCPVEEFCLALHYRNSAIVYKPATLIKRKKALLDLAYNIVKKEAKQSNLSIREIPEPHEKG